MALKIAALAIAADPWPTLAAGALCTSKSTESLVHHRERTILEWIESTTHALPAGTVIALWGSERYSRATLRDRFALHDVTYSMDLSDGYDLTIVGGSHVLVELAPQYVDVAARLRLDGTLPEISRALTHVEVRSDFKSDDEAVLSRDVRAEAEATRQLAVRILNEAVAEP